MRDVLYEGEWIVAFEKGLRMIITCREQKKSATTERIICNYFRNLMKMCPFDVDYGLTQVNLRLEKLDMWMYCNSFNIETYKSGRRYGRGDKK